VLHTFGGLRSINMNVSQDFWEKLLIVLVTAAVAGFLVPYVLKRIDETKAIEQKRLEADISRQAKIIEAQSKFLDDTTEILWSWRYLSMKVAFNGSAQREEQYTVAVREYEAGIWDVLSKLRNQTSVSRRLISEQGYRQLVALYDRIVELDSRLDQIVRRGATANERAAALVPIQNELRSEMTQQLDETLDLLANEVQLKSPQSTAAQRP
jgi:hypothetical protein